ncbi:MAG: fatty acid desaturase [Verrucomicrobiota bacterium]|nr:fatty acid desaturase [Verrucomicrobiota bacterium]
MTTQTAHTPLTKDEQVKWHRVAVEKKVMSQLMQRSDLHGFIQAGGHFALVIATGITAYYSWYKWDPAVTVLLTFIHCTFFTFLGPSAAVHELSHKSVFKTAWINDFFLRICSFLTFWNHNHYRASHVKHHQVTTYEGLDFEIVQPIKLEPMSWFWGFTINLPMIKQVLHTHWRYARLNLEGHWENKILPETNAKQRKDLANWSRLVLVGHTLLVATFIYFQLWPLLFLVTLASFTGLWLAIIVGFPQHAGLPSSVPDFRLCCRSYTTNWFFSFLYWRMNYHIEHHMYPSVPCYNLKKLSKVMEPHMPPAPKSIIECWQHLAIVLKKQKEDPTWVYRAPLPEENEADNVETDSTQVLKEAQMLA